MHAGIPTLPLRADPPPGSRPDPPDQTLPPKSRHPPPPDQAPPPGADTPLGSRLHHTVYERPVRILLECILVTFCVRSRVTFELFTLSLSRGDATSANYLNGFVKEVNHGLIWKIILNVNNIRIFHKHTKLAILALLSTLYSYIFAISFFRSISTIWC